VLKTVELQVINIIACYPFSLYDNNSCSHDAEWGHLCRYFYFLIPASCIPCVESILEQLWELRHLSTQLVNIIEDSAVGSIEDSSCSFPLRKLAAVSELIEFLKSRATLSDVNLLLLICKSVRSSDTLDPSFELPSIINDRNFLSRSEAAMLRLSRAISVSLLAAGRLEWLIGNTRLQSHQRDVGHVIIRRAVRSVLFGGDDVLKMVAAEYPGLSILTSGNSSSSSSSGSSSSASSSGGSSSHHQGGGSSWTANWRSVELFNIILFVGCTPDLLAMFCDRYSSSFDTTRADSRVCPRIIVSSIICEIYHSQVHCRHPLFVQLMNGLQRVSSVSTSIPTEDVTGAAWDYDMQSALSVRIKNLQLQLTHSLQYINLYHACLFDENCATAVCKLISYLSLQSATEPEVLRCVELFCSSGRVFDALLGFYRKRLMSPDSNKKLDSVVNLCYLMHSCSASASQVEILEIFRNGNISGLTKRHFNANSCILLRHAFSDRASLAEVANCDFSLPPIENIRGSLTKESIVWFHRYSVAALAGQFSTIAGDKESLSRDKFYHYDLHSRVNSRPLFRPENWLKTLNVADNCIHTEFSEDLGQLMTISYLSEALLEPAAFLNSMYSLSLKLVPNTEQQPAGPVCSTGMLRSFF
jgi:hypothetical protein